MKKVNAQPGDLVEISLIKTSYRGVLLEAPKDEHGIILLKLDSGYNIGFNRKDIIEIKVIKKAQEKKEQIEIRNQKNKPNIGIIITGGTIASRLDPKTGGVAPLTRPEDFFKFYPEVFKKVNVVYIEVPFMKASEDMDYKDWQKIARAAVDLLNNPEIRGIIITHGTDTLGYTAAALSFFLKNLNKPVVLTYSQRSIDRASSDSSLNLECSALAAISDIAEVMVVGHASSNDDYCYALRGTKVRKLHSSRRDAFKPVNTKPLAKIFSNTQGSRIDILGDFNKRNHQGKVKLDAKFDDKVTLIKFYPGQSPDILEYYAKKKYKGIIIEGTGFGHVAALSSRNSWLPTIKRLVAKGIFIGMTTQCIYGRVNKYVYSNLRALNKAGVVFLEDMLSETAYVKLGYILAHPEWKNKVKEKMLENLAGEFNERLEE